MVEDSNHLPVSPPQGQQSGIAEGVSSRPQCVTADLACAEKRDRGTLQTGPPDGISVEGSPGRCAGCGQPIAERYYLHAVDRKWHVQCLTCSDCHFRLETQVTCYARGGHIYCKEDYYRRFVRRRCSGCQGGIGADQLVMRAREQVFHLGCFSCFVCGRRLMPGEEFALQHQRLLCSTHCAELLDHAQRQLQLAQREPRRFQFGPAGAGGCSGGLAAPSLNGPAGLECGRVDVVPRPPPKRRPSRRRRKRKELATSEGGNMSDFAQGVAPRTRDDADSEMQVEVGHPGTGRQKRVRTSFKQHQLGTMRSYFSVNHNPDSKDLRQLALRTGLPKRVLQVWFQNARAKYRRSQLKQQATGETSSQVPGATTAAPGDSSPGADDSLSDGHGDGGVTEGFQLFSRSPGSLLDMSTVPWESGDDLLSSMEHDGCADLLWIL